MTRPLVGDVGRIISVNTNIDLTNATLVALTVIKPDETEALWIGKVYRKKYIHYAIKEGDFNIPGIYEVKAYIEAPHFAEHGDPDKFTVFAE